MIAMDKIDLRHLRHLGRHRMCLARRIYSSPYEGFSIGYLLALICEHHLLIHDKPADGLHLHDLY